MLSVAQYWIILLAAGGMAMAQSGGIVGAVISSDGAPISGATVRYSRLVNFLPKTGRTLQLAPGESHFSGSVATDSLGNQSAQGLPAGTYIVCVDVPNQPFLDPCKWGKAPSVLVQSGQTSPIRLTVTRGVFLHIRINDPHAYLPTSEKNPLDFPHLTTGVVFGAGAFLSAARISADANGQNYRMPIPIGIPLNFWIASQYVSMTDQQGRPISNKGASIPFQAIGGIDQNFTINVVANGVGNAPGSGTGIPPVPGASSPE